MPMRKSIRILMLLEKRSTPLLTKTTMTSMPEKKHWLPIPKAEAEAEEEAEAEAWPLPLASSSSSCFKDQKS